MRDNKTECLPYISCLSILKLLHWNPLTWIKLHRHMLWSGIQCCNGYPLCIHCMQHVSHSLEQYVCHNNSYTDSSINLIILSVNQFHVCRLLAPLSENRNTWIWAVYYMPTMVNCCKTHFKWCDTGWFLAQKKPTILYKVW